MDFNWLTKRAQLTPEKTAIADTSLNREWTFKELDARASASARWLSFRGIRQGDRVALISPNHIAYFDLLFACARLKAIFVPINWRLSTEEMNYILKDCKPKLIGYHPKLENKLAGLKTEPDALFNTGDEEYLFFPSFSQVPQKVFAEENEPLAIIYTGGTTGRPKGVVLSHRSIFWNGINTIVSWNLTDKDITLTCLPLFHTGGLNALSIPVLMAGGKVAIGSEFDPRETIRLINELQCTIVLLVPTMYRMMISTEEFQQSSFPSMNVFLSGGAPCPLDIYDVFQAKGLKFKEGYGLTEAGPNNFFIAPEEAAAKKGSVGKPMIFNEIRLLKEDGTEAGINQPGELLIRGKHTFEYYWNQKKATDEVLKGGWLHTGDLARKDEEGYFYIVGRKKDMIISGGENVHPLEIEHRLASHPDIGEAAVVGVPDDHWGEKVVAFIVASGKKPEETELKSFCSRKLASYKIPKQFFFIDELPKTDVGKIDKKKLQKIGISLNKSNERV